MMEVTNVHILILNKDKNLTINLHHVLSTVTMDDSVVFIDLVRKTLRFTTQQTIDIITNCVESFGGLLAVNNGDIVTFFKANHSANNPRAAAQRILISNNITQALNPYFFR